MSGLDSINDAVQRGGGRWVKLRTKADPPIEGVLLDALERDRTDPQGNVVYKRGTQTPRKEWVLTLETSLREDGEDDGIRKVPCNEGMQIAIKAALRESGQLLKVGGTLKIGVKEDPTDSFAQAKYQARWTAPPIDFVAPADDDEEPF